MWPTPGTIASRYGLTEQSALMVLLSSIDVTLMSLCRPDSSVERMLTAILDF